MIDVDNLTMFIDDTDRIDGDVSKAELNIRFERMTTMNLGMLKKV